MQRKFKITARHGEAPHKVEAIKAIRTISGIGLKEAKDIVDACGGSLGHLYLTQSFTERNHSDYPYDVYEQVAIIRRAGYDVVEVSDDLHRKVQALASEAIMAGDYHLARGLINVLDK